MNTDTLFLDEVISWMGMIPQIERKLEYTRLFRAHPHFCRAPIVTDFLTDQFFPYLLDGMSIPPSEDDVFLLHTLPSLLPYILARINDDHLAVQLRVQAVGLLLESSHPHRKKHIQEYVSHDHPSIGTAARKALNLCMEPEHISKIKSKE